MGATTRVSSHRRLGNGGGPRLVVITKLVPATMTVGGQTLRPADVAVRLRHRRPGVTGPDRGDHRVLHRHGLPPVKSVAKASVPVTAPTSSRASP